MSKSPIILLILLILQYLTYAIYVPELQVCASTIFLNKQITDFGPTIQKQLNEAKIPDISYDDKFDGVHLRFNLTNIHQIFKINWKANVINVQDTNSFILNSKNINITLNAHIQFKIGLALKQKGQLVIQVEKMEADTKLAFTQPHCTNSNEGKGIGFGVEIQSLFVNTQTLSIKIQHKGIDNIIIKAVMALLKSRLPSIIQKAAEQKGNPAINNILCKQIQQVFPLGQQKYVAIVNTTNIPHFIQKQLYTSLDLTLINAVTNATNTEIQNDNLPEQNIFKQNAQLTLLVSSNMMNSILWLIDDSKALNINLTNDKLPPNAPIALNTLNLSILMPGLLKYGRKDVILVIQPSNRFSHLYVRNGKLLAALSLSVKFIVNNTGTSQPVNQCLKRNRCILACDLNVTLPFSAAMKISHTNILSGLVHTIAIQQIKTITSQIPVKTDQLTKILNTMIGSFRPQINQIIQKGIKINLSIIKLLQIQGLQMKMKKDYAGLGIIFKQ